MTLNTPGPGVPSFFPLLTCPLPFQLCRLFVSRDNPHPTQAFNNLSYFSVFHSCMLEVSDVVVTVEYKEEVCTGKPAFVVPAGCTTSPCLKVSAQHWFAG